MERKYIDICKRLGWTVQEFEDGAVDIRKHTPAGEDFLIEDLTAADFVADVKAYVADFDQEDHVEKWAEQRRNGRENLPTVRELVKDARAIKKMLKELMAALNAESKN